MNSLHIKVIFLLFSCVLLSCSDSYDEEDFIEYEIPNSYTLDIETDKVVIIDNYSTFKSVFGNNKVKKISFKNYSLIVVKGVSGHGVDNITSKAYIGANDKITVNVCVQTNYSDMVTTWYVAYLKKKPHTQETILDIEYSN